MSCRDGEPAASKEVDVVDARVLLRRVSGTRRTAIGVLLGVGLEPCGRLRPLVGSFDRVIAGVSGRDDLIAPVAAGLPEGAARAEAIAVRLRRRDVQLAWGEAHPVADERGLLDLCRERGRSSIDMARADPSLIPELQLGSWFDAGWRLRLVRRVARPLPGAAFRRWPGRSPTALRLAADLAFWQGVRDRANAVEWRRLTRSSYVALVYHRLAGELKPGQERIDLAPGLFERQLRLLRRLGMRHLRSDEVLGFHERSDELLPRRSFVVTVDDGSLDVLGPLSRRGRMGLQLFVSTREVGGVAHWLDGEPVLNWADVRALVAKGVVVGSHAQHHVRLRGLEHTELAAELQGSLSDLRREVGSPLEILAYPNGDHDAEVCRSAREAGFRAAFTTKNGRNGAGTNPYCLKRISVHGADGALAVLWKVVTGEPLPALWQRLRQRRQSR